MKQYKPKEFSEMLLNVSVKTLRRWDNQGALTAYRNPKGRRYYVSILCEVKEVKPNSILNAVGIGIDLGIKDFAVRSDGKTHKNINRTVQVKR